jgi:hypothetical protein
MSTDINGPSRDWVRSTRTSTLAWWLPSAAIAAGLLAPMPTRTVIWIAALVWMGTACILNAKRCGRTHCRYTGPYYLAMTVPVVVLGSGLVLVGITAWLLLACVILLGSKLLWWATERTWGEFSR